jgi:uncharacterized membrane-anchored protein YhcB (DUF1043 family)
MPKRIDKRDRGDYLFKIARGIKDVDKDSFNTSKEYNKNEMNLTESLDRPKDSLDSKKESKKNHFTRVSIQISNVNMDFLRRYKKTTGIEIAPKCSELLNKELDKLRKESE